MPTSVPAAAEEGGGHISLPRRLSIAGAVSVLILLAGQLVWFGTWKQSIDGQFATLMSSDERLTKRGDDRYTEVRARIDRLEVDRADTAGRLIRLEEQGRYNGELLREIRDQVRAKR